MATRIHILFLFSSLCFALSSPAIAQQNKIDSLKVVLQKLGQDTSRVNCLNDITYQYFKIGRYDSVLLNSERAASLAKRINFTKGLGTAFTDLAWYYYSINSYKIAEDYARKSIKLNRSINYKKGEGHAMLVLANSNLLQAQYDSSALLLSKAIMLFESVDYPTGVASALSSLGNVYDLKSDYQNSVATYLKALAIYDKLNDRYGASLIYQGLAETYRKQKMYDKAMAYQHKQLSFYKSLNNVPNIASAFIGLGTIHQDKKNYDSALYYYNQSQIIYERLNDKYSVGIALNNIGDIYRLTKSYERAIHYYKKSLRICNEINDVEGSVYPLDGLGVIYTQQGNFSLAAQSLESARRTATKINLPALLSDIYLHSSQLDSARQNYKMAYDWFKKHSQLKDSLQSLDNTKAIAEMQARFESEKKDREIAFLNEEQRLKETERIRERNSLLILLLISTLLIGAMIYSIVQKIKASKIQSAQQAEITQKNEELNQMNEELKAVLETIEAQNESLAEKNQKLEDLNQEKDGLISIVAHDLRSPLTKTEGLIELMSISGPLNEQQQNLAEMIKKVCVEGNGLIKDLLEINSLECKHDDEPLKSVVEISAYLKAFALHHNPVAQEKNITLVLDVHDQQHESLVTNAEYLTRILDNLVSNAIKFSPANSTVWLSCKSFNNQILFSVRDEGPGLSVDDKVHLFKKFKRLSAKPTAGESSTGLGLSIVKTLVERLRGNVHVESAVGKGSTFTILLPAFDLTYAPHA
jgi:signal transduction histidine kinase